MSERLGAHRNRRAGYMVRRDVVSTDQLGPRPESDQAGMQLNATRRAIIDELRRIWRVSPGLRFGQLVRTAHAGTEFGGANCYRLPDEVALVTLQRCYRADEFPASPDLTKETEIRIDRILTEFTRVWAVFSDLNIAQAARCAAIGAGVRADNLYQMEDEDALRGLRACRGDSPR